MIASITKRHSFTNVNYYISKPYSGINSGTFDKIHAIGLPDKHFHFLILSRYNLLSDLYKKIKNTSALYETLSCMITKF